MEVPFSDSVFNRLPSVIKGLDLTLQKIFINLRLGKKEIDISRQLGIDENETRQKIVAVREVLTRAGLLDLIEEPRFVSIHSSSEDEPEFQLSSFDLPIEKKLIIKEFLSILRETIGSLAGDQAQLLRLRYGQSMTARDILAFSKKTNMSFVPGKSVTELDEQKIFYALNSALKELLGRLKENYQNEPFMCTENLKYVLEEVEF